MSSFALLLFADVSLEFEGWDSGGLFVFLLVVLAGCFVHAQMTAADRKRAKPIPAALVMVPPVAEAKLQDRPLFKSRLAVPPDATVDPTGKRRDKRRLGNPVDVQLTDLDGKQEPYSAVVLNRSRGGLCIACERSVIVGQKLKVRAVHAPDTVDWLQIEIRHCKNRNGMYQFGAAFKDKPPWSVVLLFG